jgi:hypothetical protein
MATKKKTTKRKAPANKKVVMEVLNRKPKAWKKNVCNNAPEKEHCFHLPVSNGYNAIYIPNGQSKCCFCGMVESELHGPYHPLNSPPKPATITGTWTPANSSYQTYTIRGTDVKSTDSYDGRNSSTDNAHSDASISTNKSHAKGRGSKKK